MSERDNNTTHARRRVGLLDLADETIEHIFQLALPSLDLSSRSRPAQLDLLLLRRRLYPILWKAVARVAYYQVYSIRVHGYIQVGCSALEHRLATFGSRVEACVVQIRFSLSIERVKIAVKTITDAIPSKAEVHLDLETFPADSRTTLLGQFEGCGNVTRLRVRHVTADSCDELAAFCLLHLPHLRTVSVDSSLTLRGIPDLARDALVGARFTRTQAALSLVWAAVKGRTSAPSSANRRTQKLAQDLRLPSSLEGLCVYAEPVTVQRCLLDLPLSLRYFCLRLQDCITPSDSQSSRSCLQSCDWTSLRNLRHFQLGLGRLSPRCRSSRIGFPVLPATLEVLQITWDETDGAWWGVPLREMWDIFSLANDVEALLSSAALPNLRRLEWVPDVGAGIVEQACYRGGIAFERRTSTDDGAWVH
jgi:hypothetical protein